MTDKNKKAPQNNEIPAHLDQESDLPPDADVEERFNDFWKKNGPGVFGGIALAAVLVTGVQFFKYQNSKKEEAIQAAFGAAMTESEKLVFVSEHGDHELVGVTQLSLGDARYAANDFVQAAEYYKSAHTILGDNPLASRALLGEGVSLLMADETAGGQAILESLALDLNVLDAVRAEAAYHLAVSRWDNKDFNGVRSAIDLIATIDGSSAWGMRAANLESQIPELLELDPEA